MREYVVFGHKLHEMLKNGVCAVNWCFIHHAVGGGPVLRMEVRGRGRTRPIGPGCAFTSASYPPRCWREPGERDWVWLQTLKPLMQRV